MAQCSGPLMMLRTSRIMLRTRRKNLLVLRPTVVGGILAAILISQILSTRHDEIKSFLATVSIFEIFGEFF